jgi:hypothetical protein
VLAVNSSGQITGITPTVITGAAPSGAAGGDLAGTFPNPTLAEINAYSAGTDPTYGPYGTFGAVGSGTLSSAGGTAAAIPQLRVDRKGRILSAGTGTNVFTINDANIGAGVVTTAKIADAAITSAKLADLSPSPAGSYGSSSLIPVVTVDAKGRVTAVTTVAPAGGSSSRIITPEANLVHAFDFRSADITSAYNTSTGILEASSIVNRATRVGTVTAATPAVAANKPWVASGGSLTNTPARFANARKTGLVAKNTLFKTDAGQSIYEFAVWVWFRMEAPAGAAKAARRLILGWACGQNAIDSSTNGKPGFAFTVYTHPTITGAAAIGFEYSHYTTASIVEGIVAAIPDGDTRWHHLAMTGVTGANYNSPYTGAAYGVGLAAEFYLDGVHVATSAGASMPGGIYNDANGVAVCIGGTNDSAAAAGAIYTAPEMSINQARIVFAGGPALAATYLGATGAATFKTMYQTGAGLLLPD